MAKRKRKSPIQKGEGAAATRERRLRFAREYLKDHNGGKAAIRAGYAKASSRASAHRILKDPEVQAYIAEHGQKMADKLEISAERVLAEFARVAFSDIREYFTESGALKDAAELSEDAARAIGSVEVKRVERRGRRTGDEAPEEIVKVKLWDKLRALEALAKHTGVLKEPPAAPGGVNWKLDPERLALMTDADVDEAIRVAKLLTGAA